MTNQRSTSSKKSTDSLPPVVERKPSKRGRKPLDKPGMDAMLKAWKKFRVGETRVLPDNSGSSSHASVTLDRYHFGKRAKAAGLTPGVDYTIESDEDHGATITRLA